VEDTRFHWAKATARRVRVKWPAYQPEQLETMLGPDRTIPAIRREPRPAGCAELAGAVGAVPVKVIA
jgi:hypothetical protein